MKSVRGDVVGWVIEYDEHHVARRMWWSWEPMPERKPKPTMPYLDGCDEWLAQHRLIEAAREYAFGDGTYRDMRDAIHKLGVPSKGEE